MGNSYLTISHMRAEHFPTSSQKKKKKISQLAFFRELSRSCSVAWTDVKICKTLFLQLLFFGLPLPFPWVSTISYISLFAEWDKSEAMCLSCLFPPTYTSPKFDNHDAPAWQKGSIAFESFADHGAGQKCFRRTSGVPDHKTVQNLTSPFTCWTSMLGHSCVLYTLSYSSSFQILSPFLLSSLLMITPNEDREGKEAAKMEK